MDIYGGRSLITRRFARTIEQRIALLGGWQWVFDRILECWPTRHIADFLGCSRWQLYRLLHDKHWPDRYAAFQKALELRDKEWPLSAKIRGEQYSPELRKAGERFDYEGHEDEMFLMFEEGHALRSVARHYQIDPGNLSRWINRDEDREARYREARRIGAAAHAERIGELADELLERTAGNPQPGQVAAYKLKMEWHKWMAQVGDKVAFGDQPASAVNVNLSLGELHLDALRSTASVDKLPPRKQPEMLEAEVVEEPDTE